MSRVFVGNLPTDVRERELDDLFYKYGRIRDIDIKVQGRPPAFAFITFESSRDAEDAVRGRDGYEFAGARLRCEISHSSRGGGGDRGREPMRGRPAGRRTDFRVYVSGLPRSASWQDLKDYMRKAGDVIYTDVDGNGEGTVEYSNPDDMENAVRKLDDTAFTNPYDKSYIRVRLAKKSGGDRSVSRSRSRDRKRSYSRSPSPDEDRRDDRRDDEDRRDDRDDEDRRDDREEEDDRKEERIDAREDDQVEPSTEPSADE